MKALLFLIFVAAVVAVVIWRLRKAQAEEVRARLEAIERRKKKASEHLTQDVEMIWPVIVKPTKGDGAASEVRAEAPSMTTIEYEPPQEKVS
jgi:hypothetical protein